MRINVDFFMYEIFVTFTLDESILLFIFSVIQLKSLRIYDHS